MKELDYFSLAAGLSRITAAQHEDPDVRYDRMREDRDLMYLENEPEDEIMHEEDLGRDGWDGIPKGR